MKNFLSAYHPKVTIKRLLKGMHHATQRYVSSPCKSLRHGMDDVHGVLGELVVVFSLAVSRGAKDVGSWVSGGSPGSCSVVP